MTEAARHKWWRPWKAATGEPPAQASPAEALATETPAAEAQLPDEQPSEFQASVERAREGWFARLRAGLSR